MGGSNRFKYLFQESRHSALMPIVRFKAMSNYRFHFSVTVRDRRFGYVDQQTWEIEPMFLEITQMWMNFAGGMGQRRNVLKSGTAEVETWKVWAEACQTSAAGAGIEAPKAPRAVGRAQHISRENVKFHSVLQKCQILWKFRGTLFQSIINQSINQ